MKKKIQVVTLLDDLRSQDPKKRLISVQSIKQIATALGPVKTRTDLLQYLTQFIDDQKTIVLSLLNQLQDFSSYLGGEQHQKTLLPLLISFCKTDQKKQAQKATQIIQLILKKNKQLIVDVIKKISKTDMNTSKQSSIKLISSLISLIPQQQQTQLLQIYSGMIFSDIPSYKIISSRYLNKILQCVKNKQQIGKLIEVIYNDNEDLTKIYALQALVNYYNVNSNFVCQKFKALFIINNWRINVKICQIVPQVAKVFSKVNFKTTFEGNLLKFMSSHQPELRSKACVVIKYLASNMTDEQIKSKLIPLIKKLAVDQVDFVKIELSKNIVSIIQSCNQNIITQQLLPIILTFIKSNQLAVGIISKLQLLSKKLANQTIQQKILTPILSQFSTDSWRVKCQLIQLFSNVINNSLFLNDKMTTFLLTLVCDKINAVRQKATQLIINIINQQSPQWCDSMLINKFKILRESHYYVERQIMLQIISKTFEKVTEKTLNDVYKVTMMNMLNDKVPNVRAKALKVLKGNKKLYDKGLEKCLDKLKSDNDFEVRQIAIGLKI